MISRRTEVSIMYFPENKYLRNTSTSMIKMTLNIQHSILFWKVINFIHKYRPYRDSKQSGILCHTNKNFYMHRCIHDFRYGEEMKNICLRRRKTFTSKENNQWYFQMYYLILTNDRCEWAEQSISSLNKWEKINSYALI